ncbi:sulfurtransferase [Horticoccus sp. 23ND18S-11]|uniref:sulfurtransferase n=1 Tax=Horticoccus sp. 23ND18S-11 TaxID=3391832 RepID=UPI0039C99D14
MLVSTAELAQHLTDPAWVIFDCRHDLMDTAKGRRFYQESHVPGAHFAPVDTALSGPKTGRNGRHPLPKPETFADFLGHHGVTAAKTVVAYDDVGGQYAARLWWMARWIGLTQVVLLDGGLPKWVADGRPVSAEVPRPTPAILPARLSDRSLWRVTEVQKRLGDSRSLVIDARAAERYRGETEPLDPVAGHIPGAANRFYKANLRPDLTLRPADELKREFTALLAGRKPEDVAHQCGSGITACANLFAMEYAGLPGSNLYAGSWSEWVADSARPVAKG